MFLNLLSYLSLLPSTLTILDVIKELLHQNKNETLIELKSTQVFKNLESQLKLDNNLSQTYIKQVLANALDPIVKPILENKELNLIYTSSMYVKYSQEDLNKVYITKVIKFILDTLEKKLIKELPEYANLLSLVDKKHKLILVEETIELLDDHLVFSNIKSSNEFYENIINMLTTWLNTYFETYALHQDITYETILQSITEKLNYKSKYIKNNIQDNLNTQVTPTQVKPTQVKPNNPITPTPPTQVKPITPITPITPTPPTQVNPNKRPRDVSSDSSDSNDSSDSSDSDKDPKKPKNITKNKVHKKPKI